MYPETKQKYRDLLLAGSFFYSLITMVIMVILTPIIVRQLIVQRQRRKQMASQKRQQQDRLRHCEAISYVDRCRRCLCHLHLAFTIVHNLAFWKNVSAFDTNTFDFFILREIAQMLEQFNYSINFFLYVLCSAQFRARVINILRLGRVFSKPETSADSKPNVKNGSSNLKPGTGNDEKIATD